MRAFAAKTSTNFSSVRKNLWTWNRLIQNTNNVSSISNKSELIQRKPVCPCGGGCPRCKDSQPLFQTKLKISDSGDKYEQEADRIADQIMRMPNHEVTGISHVNTNIHRKCAECTSGEDLCPGCEDDEEGLVQRKLHNDRNANGSVVHDNFPQHLSPGQPLEPDIRAFFEPRFGYDFSNVRVHTDTKAAESAQSVNALGYTLGRDVVFGTGQYAPGTPLGKTLIAHELIHVIQQKGKSRRLQRRVDPARVDERLCRSCISHRPDGTCDFWLYYDRSYIERLLVEADSAAINLALRASHLLSLQRLTFGTARYDPVDQFSIASRLALSNRFGLDIENRLDHARIQLIEGRYLGVANLLQSGSIRYRCGCDRERNWAESLRSPARVWICRRFLESTNAVERAQTLLHEPFHIVYRLGHGGTLNNIWNYEDFSTDVEAIPTPLPTVSDIAGVRTQATAFGEASPAEGGGMDLATRGDNDIHTGVELEEEMI